MKRILSNLYTGGVIFSPIFSLYYFFNSKLLFLDIYIIIFVILSFFKIYIYKKYIYIEILIIIYILISLNLNKNDIGFENIMRGIKYIVYTSYVFIYTNQFFNFDFGYKLYKFLNYLIIFHLILQNIFRHFFNIYISGSISFLEKIGFIHVNPDIFEKNIYMLNYRRFASIFIEPSHMAVFLIPFLLIELFYRKKYISSVFISIGLLLTVSSTGILILIVLWGIKIIISKGNEKRKIITLIIIFIILGLFFCYPQLKLFTERMDSGVSAKARFGFYLNVLKYKISVIKLTFGNGMRDYRDLKTYIPGWGRFFLNFGIIGIFLEILLYSYIYFQNKILYKRIFILIFFLVNIGSDVIFNSYFILYMTWIIGYKKR